MVKIILLTATVVFIKFILYAFLFIFVIANYESNKILNQKSYHNGQRYTNFYIRPKTLENTPDNVAIGNILFIAYWNFVFDITYSKLLYGKYYMFKMITIKDFFIKIFFLYLGISRLMLKIILHILKINKTKNLENYLFSIFLKPIDNRIIVKINNKWKINSGLKIFLMLSKKKLVQELHFDDPKINKALEKFSECYKKMSEINHNTTIFKAKFITKNTLIPHNVYIKSSKDPDLYGYQTSYNSAFNKNFFNKKPLIHKYEGVTKESTLLPHNKNELKQISTEKKVSFLKQIYGAVKYGYDAENLSSIYLDPINNILEIDEIINDTLKEIGINENKLEVIKISIMSEMIQSIDVDINEN